MYAIILFHTVIANWHSVSFSLSRLNATSVLLIAELIDYVIIVLSTWTASKLLSDYQNV